MPAGLKRGLEEEIRGGNKPNIYCDYVRLNVVKVKPLSANNELQYGTATDGNATANHVQPLEPTLLEDI